LSIPMQAQCHAALFRLLKSVHKKFCEWNSDAVSFPPVMISGHKIGCEIERHSANRSAVTLKPAAVSSGDYSQPAGIGSAYLHISMSTKMPLSLLRGANGERLLSG